MSILDLNCFISHFQMEDSLPTYMDVFDIVLLDDQTMNVPRAIFSLLKEPL